MSIPLVQNNDKDAINTSIIAIKRNIERINMLLGLVDSGSPDLSGLATKQELEDAVNSLQPVDEVALNNMQSVTSNAVAKCLSYSTTEQKTGGKWIDGKPIYRMTIQTTIENGVTKELNLSSLSIDKLVAYSGWFVNTGWGGYWYQIPYISNDRNHILSVQYTATTSILAFTSASTVGVFGGTVYFTIEYTKTTD